MGLHVLIVDDQDTNRQGVSALFEFAPDIEEIYEAGSGLDAVRIAAKAQPDVVLMDVRMPVMDGLEATRQIKKRWPHIFVIVLTMYASHREEALAARADRFMIKGTAGDSLMAVIRSLATSRKDSAP